ncbi:MAG TPA: hypothetical protein VL326_16975, partial [Kofleriaceae bacterium]|nr:hypothetical protein [Kofleriaceae bacterium]
MNDELAHDFKALAAATAHVPSHAHTCAALDAALDKETWMSRIASRPLVSLALLVLLLVPIAVIVTKKSLNQAPSIDISALSDSPSAKEEATAPGGAVGVPEASPPVVVPPPAITRRVAPLPQHHGELRLHVNTPADSLPESVTLLIEGTKVTSADGTFTVELAPGLHRVLIQKPGLRDVELDATIDPDGV